MEKKKLVNNYYQRSKKAFLENFPQIIILILLAQLLLAVHSLPHVNVIPDYYIYVFLLLLIVAWISFFKYFTSKRMLLLALLTLLLAYPALVIGIIAISEILGFIAYMLFIMAILQMIVRCRTVLRQALKENEKHR
jgi:hypothetical protein